MNKEERIAEFKRKMKIKCVHNILGGTGDYCKLKLMEGRDYPHK